MNIKITITDYEIEKQKIEFDLEINITGTITSLYPPKTSAAEEK